MFQSIQVRKKESITKMLLCYTFPVKSFTINVDMLMSER